VSAPPTLFRVADRARRVVWRVFGPRTVGVRGLVIDADGRVLLVRHTYGRAYWHLPGGGVKRRESLVAGLHRELREEAGVIVTGPVTLLGTYSSLTEGKSDHISVFEVARYVRQQSASGEISDIALFAPGDLPEDTSPATRRRIEEWQRGEVPAFDW
jgi:ADP-ribose pyrophosphatase YjhB (NUDIX family)